MEGDTMGAYLYEVSYTADAWAKQLANPTNRIDAVKPVILAAGGKVVNAYYAFGDADVILIAELPDNVSAASLSLAFTAGGAVSSCKTTVLMSVDDGLAAITNAGKLSSSYKPPA
jgi:uncharacterized protein with GYD domain